MGSHVLALAGAVIFNATANLLLKFAAWQLNSDRPLFASGLGQGVSKALTCPVLILGLIFFALNVPLYFLALAKLKVSVAYPIMVGAGFAIIVTVASLSGLGERLDPTAWVGVGMILLGVIIVCTTLGG